MNNDIEQKYIRFSYQVSDRIIGCVPARIIRNNYTQDVVSVWNYIKNATILMPPISIQFKGDRPPLSVLIACGLGVAAYKSPISGVVEIAASLGSSNVRFVLPDKIKSVDVNKYQNNIDDYVVDTVNERLILNVQ